MSILRSTARSIAYAGARALPFGVAAFISRHLLEAHGIGSGGNFSSSGELGAVRLVKSESPLLFDVGAHIGEYARGFLERLPNGRAFCFEPDSAHLQLLRQNMCGNKKVRIFPIALGAKSGRQPLFKDATISGFASLTKRRLDHYGIAMNLSEVVTIDTVDQIVAESDVKKIDLLKLDVEGHELSVLCGAVASMERKIIKAVQFEFGGSNLDTRTTLQDFFYFFSQFDFHIGLLRPNGRIHELKKYDEFYEQYRTTNYVAAPNLA